MTFNVKEKLHWTFVKNNKADYIWAISVQKETSLQNWLNFSYNKLS